MACLTSSGSGDERRDRRIDEIDEKSHWRRRRKSRILRLMKGEMCLEETDRLNVR